MRARFLPPLLILLLSTCGPALSAQVDTTTLAVQIDTICAEDPLTARATGTYQWSTGALTESIFPAASGPYTVTITATNGDVVIDPRDVEVLVVPDPVLPVAQTPPPYCPGQPVTFTVTLTGYDSLQWNDARGTIFEGFGDNGEFVTIPAFPGAGISYIADYPRCNESLTVLPPLEFTAEDFTAGLVAELSGAPDTALCPGDNLTLTVSGERITGVEWADGDTSRVRTFTVEQSSDYSVTVFSSCDTTAVLTAEIVVSECTEEPPATTCEAVFPGVITPNGDGTNDRFRLLTNCPPTTYTLRVYNRWGQPVFSSTDADESWDGTRNGTPQNTDTYLYYAQYQLSPDDEPVEASGQFALIR